MRGEVVLNPFRHRLPAWLLGGVAIGIVAGCQTPFDARSGEPSFEQTVAAALNREIATLAADDEMRETTQPPAAVERELEGRLDELEAIAPATPSNPIEFDLGQDLVGESQQSVSIDLDTAIATAVERNLLIQIAQLQPAINAEDVINAKAAFDFVLFGNVDLTKTDQPQPVPLIEDPMTGALFRVGTPFNASERYRFETGVSKLFTTGGVLTASTDLTRFRNNSPGATFDPDPAYTAAIRLGFTQPLLRGFGSDVNTATIRFAENAESRAVAQLERNLLDLVFQTEDAYWRLVYAWRTIEVSQWLVDVGIEVREVLGRRRDWDTKLAEYSDAVARVEQRQADVIRARRAIRAASDSLKSLLNDPELTLGSELLLKPSDELIASPIEYNLRESILTALNNRPEIREALLEIDDADLTRLLADNARLPLLNVSGEIAYFGLDDQVGSAYANSLDNDFIDYILGLVFEYPLGNRGPEAEFRRTRLVRTQALLGYRQAVQDIVLDVKAALRDVVTNYELIEWTRSSRIAQAENLRALLVEEETLAGLTPEFLNLKFQRQESLALARLEEFEALVAFDQAVAGLYRALGVGLSMRNIALEPYIGERALDPTIP
jgi:outer membrane protein